MFLESRKNFDNFDFCDAVRCELDELGKPKYSKPVDQFYSEKFNLAENGFSRSDVNLFLHTESEDLKMQIATRMDEIKSKYPDQNLSDETLAKITIPRYVQSGSDLRDWVSVIDECGISKAVDEFVKAHQPKVDEQPSEKIVFDENNPE